MNVFRVTMYVKNLNGHIMGVQDLKNTLEHYKYLPFTDVTEVLETDIGEWHDDHELNFMNCDYAKYFPDAEYHPDPLFPLKEYRRVRTIMLKTIRELGNAESEIHALKERLKKLEKVENFMNSMKDTLK